MRIDRRTALRTARPGAASLLGACGFQLRGQPGRPAVRDHLPRPSRHLAARHRVAAQHPRPPAARSWSTAQEARRRSSTCCRDRGRSHPVVEQPGRVREYPLCYKLRFRVLDNGRQGFPAADQHPAKARYQLQRSAGVVEGSRRSVAVPRHAKRSGAADPAPPGALHPAESQPRNMERIRCNYGPTPCRAPEQAAGGAVCDLQRRASAGAGGGRCDPQGGPRARHCRTRGAAGRPQLQMGRTAGRQSVAIAVRRQETDRTAHPDRQAGQGRRPGAATLCGTAWARTMSR